ncbi:hypothetical protein RND71_035548 [Anisodus tanguticus]|uniref:DUF7798 domain-containing protein n=1 Tax=Anisodus tanguticus TaxID=243964 RepID=A0AAE1R787_9SOLA|nr:hypothetical protein RND71_035548 [Anisodus tanguticus]
MHIVSNLHWQRNSSIQRKLVPGSWRHCPTITLCCSTGKKAKLPSDQRSTYDGKLKEVQQIFDLSSDVDGSDIESEKGKKVEIGTWDSTDEVKNLHNSSVNKAAELAAGFANALAGLAPNDMIQRTTGRLDTLHSEGVHRLSELCCFAVTQLLVLRKSIISCANKVVDHDDKEETGKIDWPEDSIERANVIRAKAQSMTRCVQAVSSSFVTDVAEAYLAEIKGASSGSQDSQKSIQEKANVYSGDLRAEHNTAIGKIQDGIQYLSDVVVSTSMPACLNFLMQRFSLFCSFIVFPTGCQYLHPFSLVQPESLLSSVRKSLLRSLLW